MTDQELHDWSLELKRRTGAVAEHLERLVPDVLALREMDHVATGKCILALALIFYLQARGPVFGLAQLKRDAAQLAARG